MRTCKFDKKYACMVIPRGKGKWDLEQECQTCPMLYNLFKKGIRQTTLGGGDSLVVEKWVKEAKEKADKEREIFMKEQEGYEELWTAPQGESNITIDTTKEPRIAETQYGDRQVLRIQILEDKTLVEKDWMINPKSPLWAEVLDRLAEDKPCMTLIRVGERKQTRYTLKPLPKEKK